MKRGKDCIAMLLAGGQGSRLEALTKATAKPAVSFGGKFRIIDFSLSNCANSNINTVGVLTQYRPYVLNSYIGSGSAWGLDSKDGGVSILPPYATESGGSWYEGTADAIYQNLEYIRLYHPKYVVILSGDHLYRMDYQKMLDFHIHSEADLTIAVKSVPLEEASRFGIMSTNKSGRITKFMEKPEHPESNLASMGIYIFNADCLEKALIEDHEKEDSEHDFGKNIIPTLLKNKGRLFAYEFSGFWKDVGTIPSYYHTSMNLLSKHPELDLYDRSFPIYSNEEVNPAHYISKDADMHNCIIGNGTEIFGKVHHCILSSDCYIGQGAEVTDSILLPGARVEENAIVTRSIMGENSVVKKGASLGAEKGRITVIGDAQVIE
ncbi:MULTISPECIES: glucose-1-phosphate adenylyltransferase [Terrabacteria group]|uniref:glucose-1-phosphate adenylyltransferase n=1 Tax=Bacillati TaxID=1783272 RepID=UPI00193A76E5|nr:MULTISPECIES: glucose-1-phosphate adenylyltransferase [Terrabacteria group]MBW9211994.1 glucose-1-phosphate adenylyltransferase [Trueperella sp. zg.1013]QRG87201.1 glucose-1-phosphate adenylyltransferase [Bulleidia sp. zg-1006]